MAFVTSPLTSLYPSLSLRWEGHAVLCLFEYPSSFLGKAGSNLLHRALSLNKVVESMSPSKSETAKVVLLSCSKAPFELPNSSFTILILTVFGSLSCCCSNGEVPSAFFPLRNAYKISDSPELSYFRTTFVFTRSRSFMVLIILSMLPFTR